MLNFLSLLNPTTIKIGSIFLVVGGIASAGYYLGNKMSEAKLKEVEILALQCEMRGRQREIEIAQKALEEEQARLAYEKELTARIEEELKKNAKLSKQLEEELKKKKVVTREVIKYVTKEIEKTVYRECVIPPTGVSALIQAAREYNIFRAPTPKSNN